MPASKTTRRTRPEPARTGPDRAWTRNARRNGAAPAAPPAPADATPSSASATNGAAPPPSDGGAPASTGADPAANGASNGSNGAGASAFRTLNDAYRLVDEYMRQGQEMAANVWMPFAGNGAPSWPVPGAPERFLRAMGDMTLAWIEAMQTFTNPQPAATRPPSGTAGPFQTASASTAPSPTPTAAATPAPPVTTQAAKQRELAISVVAKGRVEVAAAFSELSEPADLEACELRPAQGKAAPLRDVTLRAEAERIVVRVVVPDGQPRGTYNGLVLDAKTQKPRGTLSVVVE
jgi:hypothetical protein